MKLLRLKDADKPDYPTFINVDDIAGFERMFTVYPQEPYTAVYIRGREAPVKVFEFPETIYNMINPNETVQS